MGDDDTTPSKQYDLDIHDRITKIEGDLKYARRDIKDLKEQIRWAVKIVLGAVIGAILSGVILKSTMNTPSSAPARSYQSSPSQSGYPQSSYSPSYQQSSGSNQPPLQKGSVP